MHAVRGTRVDLFGTVVEWGKGDGTVGLDDGRTVRARWSGEASKMPDRRPGAPGERVRVTRDSSGIYRATRLARAPGELPGGPFGWRKPAPPRPAPPPLPPMLLRAVQGALAAGESAWTIAARHGVSVERVRR
jgi:hypothetical protein